MKKSFRQKRTSSDQASDATRIRSDGCSGVEGSDQKPGPSSSRRTSPSRETRTPTAPTGVRPSALPMSTIAVPPKAGSPELLELLGHTPSCVHLSKAGLVASCDCKPGRMQDPAIAIGVVIHFARLAMAQRAGLPTLITELLTTHLEAGDPACIMVAEWLDRSGLIELPVTYARGRRIR